MQAKNGLFDSFIESVIYPYPWYGVCRIKEYVSFILKGTLIESGLNRFYNLW